MKYIYYVLILVGLWGCQSPPQTVIVLNTDRLVSEDYIGNGAQWDPYQLDYGKGVWEISDDDWKKMYARLDFMRPQFMRIMTNTTSVMKSGELQPEIGLEHLSHLLDYCQSRNVTVIFGDWGDGMVDAKERIIHKRNITAAAEYVSFLLKEKGYSCIRYYNLVNEPNGYWSSTDGNFSLWAEAIRYFHHELERIGIAEQLSVVGPDAAIWTTDEIWWTDSCATILDKQIGLFDIHTYPSKTTVNSGAFTNILQAYKAIVPSGKKIVMGEIGFKFVEEVDSLYQRENMRRASAKPYASLDDSQMFVYDVMYGVDMADALIQTVNAGFAGSVAWMMDDAMHAKESPDKLKVWGFWNIFGDEFFGEEEEKIRPWFYAWSLLTRYMPKGIDVYQVVTEGDTAVKAMVAGKDGKITIAVVNVSETDKKAVLKSKALMELTGVKRYVYAENRLPEQDELHWEPMEEGMSLHLSDGEKVLLPAMSITLYTNFE